MTAVSELEQRRAVNCIWNAAHDYRFQPDFKAYDAAHRKIEEAYRDEKRWAKMGIMNMASSGKFTSDRTIQQYIDEIWHLDHVVVKVDPNSFDQASLSGQNSSSRVLPRTRQILMHRLIVGL